MQAVLSYPTPGLQLSNRALKIAVGASFALHAVLMFGVTFLHSPAKRQTPPGTLVARLSAPAPVAVQPSPEPPKPQVQPAPPPPPVKSAPAPVLAPSPLATPSARPAPNAPSAPAESPRASEAPAAPPAPSTPAAPSSSASAAKPEAQPGAAAASADPSDAATLAQYRLAVITMARKYKQYPRVAMDNNWEGRSEIRMVIGANGMIASIAVKTSAGHEVLDKAALSMIQKAKPLIPIPGNLRGKEFTVDIPVVFSLKDEAQS